MNLERKITVEDILRDGVQIGLKNAASLIFAVLLWFITLWIPYVNVGTTIALATIPIELSKGQIISPTFVFDAKYYRYMGEYFTLAGMKAMSVLPALLFMIVPGIIISLGWSLAVYIMLDKGIAPGEALVRSNRATYGYKWTIFFVYVALGILFFITSALFIKVITFIASGLVSIVTLLFFICFISICLGCNAAIYRDLTKEAISVTEGENEKIEKI